MPKKKDRKTQIFTIVSLLLFFFFALSLFHDWANNLSINLHFCNHTACIIYSFIWVAFGIIGYKHLKDKKKIKDSLIFISLVVLVVGIILMNIIYCDVEGKMSFNRQVLLKPNISIEVPIPPCRETDSGRDLISFGSIRSGVNIDDVCMSEDILRERYCDSETTYTSEDVSCSDYREDYVCEDGECVYSPPTISPTPTPSPSPSPSLENTITLCSDGIDNDGDGSIDCADTDCLDDWCECGHGSTIEPPECGGRCDEGYYCAEYVTDSNSWCECVPDGETPCGSSNVGSGIDCDGWCTEGDYCIHIPYEDDCFCSPWHCYDSDGGFYPETLGCVYWEDITCDYCGKTGLIEITCSETEPFYNPEINCSIYGEGYICVWGMGGAYCGEGEL